MANEAACSVIPTATLFSTVIGTSVVPTLVTTASSIYATSLSISVEIDSTIVNGSTLVDQITRTTPIVQTTNVPVVVTSSLPVTETRSLAYTTLVSTSCPSIPTSSSSIAASSSITSSFVSVRTTSSSFSSLIVQPTSLSSSSSSTLPRSSMRTTTSGVNIAATEVQNVVNGSNTNAHQSTSYRTVYFTSTVTNNGVESAQQYSSQTAVAVGPASNTAAIAGGVVGGIVVVALAAIALLLLLRRKQKLSSQVFSGKDIFQPGHHSEKDSSSVIDAASGDAGPTALSFDFSDEAAVWHTESTASAASSHSGGVGARADREGHVEDNQTGRRLSGYLPRVDEDNFQNSPANLYLRETSAYNAPVPLVAPLSPKSYYSSRSLHSPQSPSSPRSLHSSHSFHSQQSHQSLQSYFPQSPPLFDRRQSSQYSISSTNSQIEYLSNTTPTTSHPNWTSTHAGPPSSSSSVKHLMRPGSESSSWIPEQQEKGQQSISKEAEGNSRTNRGTRSRDVIEEEAEAPPRYLW
ncbi:hypothetical protein [Phaffia rhodozyma]|uniref:Uncharacterized protein n=1 Tax=Phaffia rhodozyma TaxID=264483 RepID=A0A0F7SPJ6_PHARH|nr:hypothetical protein [Phaffia rhodozyma]